MPVSPKPPQDGLFDSYYYDELVPPDHELMLIDRHISFSFVYPLVQDCYAGIGRPPVDPAIMLRFCFLKDYANLSDAELEQQCRYNFLYRKFLHLKGNKRPPDSTSLTVFRQRLGEERMKACLDRVAQAASEAGLVGSKRVHVDSTGIVADIAIPRLRGLALSAVQDALDALDALGLRAEVESLRLHWTALQANSEYWQTKERRDAHVLACWELLGRVADVYDDLMDREGWNEVQEGLILEQAGLLEKVLQRQSARKTSERRDLIVSTEDPDARWNNRQEGKRPFPGYKEHIIEDEASGIVTDVIVTPANVDDSTQLEALVQGHEMNADATPEGVGGDAKYHTGPNREYLAGEGIEAYIAVPAAKGEKQGMFSAGDFEYDAEGDCVMCPAGQIAEGGKWDEKERGRTYYFRKGQCEGCALREQCSKSKRGRTVFISDYREVLQSARAAKDSPEQLEGQVRRLGIERTFALQKRRHGLGRTRYRTLGRVRIGVYLNVMVVNIRRIVKHLMSLGAQGQGGGGTPEVPRQGVIACGG
ncbi:MAG: IS1182 family transposase [Chloroflexi bacterium]|nr:IS1182 family transposase [Chloroflexota bacterium]